MALKNVKLATFDLHNNTAEKSAKLHEDSLLLNFTQTKKIMNTVEETKRLIEEPRLEE